MEILEVEKQFKWKFNFNRREREGRGGSVLFSIIIFLLGDSFGKTIGILFSFSFPPFSLSPLPPFSLSLSFQIFSFSPSPLLHLFRINRNCYLALTKDKIDLPRIKLQQNKFCKCRLFIRLCNVQHYLNTKLMRN